MSTTNWNSSAYAPIRELTAAQKLESAQTDLRFARKAVEEAEKVLVNEIVAEVSAAINENGQAYLNAETEVQVGLRQLRHVICALWNDGRRNNSLHTIQSCASEIYALLEKYREDAALIRFGEEPMPIHPSFKINGIPAADYKFDDDSDWGEDAADLDAAGML